MGLLWFILGVIVAGIVFFLVWRNNKDKFTQTMFDIDSALSKYDTKEELVAVIEELINKLKLKK